MEGLDELLGESAAIRAVRDNIRRLSTHPQASQRLPSILIQGETGTGKGLVARLIHRHGPRAGDPFVDVNCAAIPETLLEAELFGFERGAFTDARRAKPGLFQTAHRGTIFLDEIGLLPEALQAKLLKVLEEQAVRRLGSTTSEPLDVWIISATNTELQSAIAAHRFREDLYHRLAVLTLQLPPLRDRGQDVLLLAERFLARACADYGLPSKTMSVETKRRLLTYRWPGNVRELGNVIERLVLLAEGAVVSADLLELPTGTVARPAASHPGPIPASLEETVQEHLLAALTGTGWNISRTAALLGISRNTLRARINKFGLRAGTAPAGSRSRPAGAPAPAPFATDSELTAAVTVPPGPIPAPLAIRWENRRVTLLLATLTTPEDDEELPGTSRALDVLLDKLRVFGGRIEELSPHGVGAVFGLEPVEDAPRRAAHAAMALQKAAERGRQGNGEPFRVKVGIHVGQVLVAQSSTGAEIDANARRAQWGVLDSLLAGTASDCILVSPAAVPFLERRFDFVVESGPAGHVHRLEGRERKGLALQGEMAWFVGRRQELDLLKSRLATARAGHGQIVGIVGEAGIGKSRLLYEFRQALRGEAIIYIEGHCLSYGSGIPYLPALEMLRHACRIMEADDTETVTEKLTVNLRHLGIEPEEALPYLLHFLGNKEGTEALAASAPEAIRRRTFQLLRQMSINASRLRPVIIAVEDMHWIDAASEALGAMAESLEGIHLLLVLTYRPGYRPPWIEKSHMTQVALQPLSTEESLNVLGGLLPPARLSESVAQFILSKAEGNPLFLEELARTVREQSDLSPAVTVPDTLQEVLLARINRLPERERRVLQSAAVIGKNVSLDVLRAIADLPDRALTDALGQLREADFLYEASSGPEVQYSFKHVLTQEVTYDSLGTAHRQALHAATARALETLYAGRIEEVYDRLAYHYSKAEHTEKATEYLARFARKLARGHFHLEAIVTIKEALGHAKRLPAEFRDRITLDLVLRQVQSLNFLGRNRESLELLLRHRERVEALEDASRAAPYYFSLGNNYDLLGDHGEGVTCLKRSVEEAERCADERTLGRAYALLTLHSYWAGQPESGLEYGHHAIELLERTKQPYWLGLAHFYIATVHYMHGDAELALKGADRAAAVGRDIGHSGIQSYGCMTEGGVRAWMGDWDIGIEACRRGLELAPDPLTTTLATGMLGYAYLERGDTAQALPLLERAVRRMEEFGYRQNHAWFTGMLAETYLLVGDREKARELGREGLRVAEEAAFPFGRGFAQRVLGRIALAERDWAEAANSLGAALGTFASIPARFELARTHLDLGILAAAQRRRTETTAHLNAAHRIFATLGLSRYVERSRKLAREHDISLSDEPIP